MQKTVLDSYLNQLKKDPKYLGVSDEWNWGLFNIWELSEDDNELRIMLHRTIRPIWHTVMVSIVMFLLASGLVWFLHGKRVSPNSFFLIYLIVFLTIVLMISFGFGARRSLIKKGRSWFIWNQLERTVSLPHGSITLSCADILALQLDCSAGEGIKSFKIIAVTNGILNKYHIFQLGGGKKQMQVIRTVACRLKKPLIISTYPWNGRGDVTVEDFAEPGSDGKN